MIQAFKGERENLFSKFNKIGKMRVVDPYSFKIYSIKIGEMRIGAGSQSGLSG